MGIRARGWQLLILLSGESKVKLARLNLEKSINVVFWLPHIKYVRSASQVIANLYCSVFLLRPPFWNNARVNSHVIKIPQSLTRTTGNQSTSFKSLLDTHFWTPPSAKGLISLFTLSWFELEKKDWFKSICSVHGTFKRYWIFYEYSARMGKTAWLPW